MLTPRHIRAARAFSGWTQAFLAAASGVSEVALKNLERGASDPRASTLKKIEETFEMVGFEFSNGSSPGIRLIIGGDPNLLYRQACLAAEVIAAGKSLDDFVGDRGDYGRGFRVRDALLRASVQLSGDLDDDAWDVFAKALNRTDALPPSKRMTECCQSLILAYS